jgi:hypothetical protein
VPAYIFPEGDLMAALIDLYFTRHNIFMPLLHRPTFEQSLRHGLHLRNRNFGGVGLLVCAIGATFSDDPRCLADGETSLLSNGWRWFNQVRLDNSWVRAPCLYHIQVTCVSVISL